MTHRNGDVLMLTAGGCAGCIVVVSDHWLSHSGGIDYSCECAEQQYFTDSLCHELSTATYDAISAHPKHGAGEFPFKCVKLGRL